MERGDLTGAMLDGRYRVIGPVAQGAMGTVYRAERVKLGRIVAVKVLHEVLPNELAGRKRFEIEAMAMAKLEHPHCASVLDVGVHNDRPYVVMEFVSGQNLKELIATGAQPIPRAIEIVRQVLSGLAHAHELGIIHRDIKPANLVLSQKTGLGDHVKILDFGLARFHVAGQNLTTGVVVGTPAYMAPEQIRGTPLDPRADLYACGVLLFELLTARKPFHSEADDPIEVCRMHLKEPVPRLDDVLPGTVFGELEAVVAKALAKARDDRYASAQEFAAALDLAAVRRPSRQSLPPVPPSGPIALGPGDLIEPDASYPPAVEVRTSDVIAAVRETAGEATGALPSPTARATPPAGLRTSAGPPVTTPPAGVRRPSGEVRVATPPAGVRRPSGEVRIATPPAGVRATAGAATDGKGSTGGAGPRDSQVRGNPFGARGEAYAESSIVEDPNAPATFFGMKVRASTPVPRAGAAGRRALWRRPAAIAGGALVAVALAGTAFVALRDGAPQPAPRSAGRGAAVAADPPREAIARATELAEKGDREGALDVLRRARKQSPDSAALAYTTGRIAFSKFYWTEGLKSFRDAIRIQPSYRTDPELIKTVLRGFITTPSYNDDLAGFLRDDIGSAAQPFLEETARAHPSAMIRSRAATELKRYPGAR